MAAVCRNTLRRPSFRRCSGTDGRRCQRRVMRRWMASRVSGRPVRVGNFAVSEASSRSRRQSCRVFVVALVDNQASVTRTRIMPTFRG